ncbi:hypothetical protein [Arthrobacter sp. efr-133-TYG-118]|uniref:hypothetical protein n=1 Tax=Arthrobacter sp. efr-133-TYG-118 TaxID=3040279 RepID=UPI00254A0903|nr:hypothetical protein [Arthrobacter sp. efr-133-TYG-118]
MMTRQDAIAYFLAMSIADAGEHLTSEQMPLHWAETTDAFHALGVEDKELA